MEFDHLFFFVEPGGGQTRNALEALGLVETYRRQHPGQGTANICYAFENAFLELLWLTDRKEATSPVIRRTGLAQRADWRTHETHPFGIAWHISSTTTQQPVPTWPFHPPYMPPDHPIPVACLSDDPQQPMLFCSPGKEAPLQWAPARRGALQEAAGFTSLDQLRLFVPQDLNRHPDLESLEKQGLFSLVSAPQAQLPKVEIRLHHRHSQHYTLTLP